MARPRRGGVLLLVAMAVMAMVARPADAAKVVIPPGKTECVSAEFAAMHFDVSFKEGCVGE